MSYVKNPSPKLLQTLSFIQENKYMMLDILFEASTRHCIRTEDNQQYKDEVLLTFDLLKNVILES
ncbi:hypothetical protein [Aureispira sp. CCB-E]|uniref:hypothetical protein n=1 Tax=Aureispira sp. CCB-E TaxID=3051121 RepID=UPI002868D3D1|nr:hypothetical protein [Aureispira sp. CCB-E]WMX17492.1 hypothetical protein QP953_14010 [Aureispira sp. CCB-E]